MEALNTSRLMFLVRSASTSNSYQYALGLGQVATFLNSKRVYFEGDNNVTEKDPNFYSSKDRQ